MEKNRLQIEWEKVSKDNDAINLIDTNFHDNGFMIPEDIMREFMFDYFTIRSYKPDSKGYSPARKSISTYYAKSGINVDPENILLTSSSSESYNLLFNNLTEPGDNIIFPSPTYPLFEFIADFNRLETRFYNMNFDDSFKIDVNSIKNAIDCRTKILVLISPNNPTGQIIDNDTLTEIVHLCCDRDIMLISDEVFSEFIYETLPVNESNIYLPRPSSINPKATVFTLNGISKMFASPDLKLSWISITGDKDKITPIVEQLEVSNDVFLSCNSLSQYVLPKLFANSEEFISSMIKRLDKPRKLITDTLSGHDSITVIPPKAGIHCVIKINGLVNGNKSNISDNYDGEDFAVDLVTKKKLYLHPGYFYGLDDGIYAVMSFLKDESSFTEGLQRLIEFVNKQ